MGMSASQIRYCMLQARKNDVEYQGQQINQQRTTLATQSAAHNTELLTLTVPTPPSTEQYTTANYTFSKFGTECSIKGLNVDDNGNYRVLYTSKVIEDRATQGSSFSYIVKKDDNGEINERKVILDGKEYQLTNCADPLPTELRNIHEVNTKIINDDFGRYEDKDINYSYDKRTGFYSKTVDALPNTLNGNDFGDVNDDNLSFPAIVNNITQAEYENDVATVGNLGTITRTVKDGVITYTGAGIKCIVDNNTTTYECTEGNKGVIYTSTSNNGEASISKKVVSLIGEDGAIYTQNAGSNPVTYTKTVGVGNSNYNFVQTEDLSGNVTYSNRVYDSRYDAADYYFIELNNGTTTYAYFSAEELNEAERNKLNVKDYIVSAQKVDKTERMTADINWSDSGRMSSITQLILNEEKTQAAGKNVYETGKTFSLEINTVTDNDAYQNAYNEYLYQKDRYNRTMDEINAKLDIIQAQDKELELQLRNLDTQQKAITTEMDAVKSVTDKNVEKSFNIFG